MKIFVVTLKEVFITGIPGKTWICGAHKHKPSDFRIGEYAKDWQVNKEDFEITELSLEN